MYDETEYGVESLWSPDMAQYQGSIIILNIELCTLPTLSLSLSLSHQTHTHTHRHTHTHTHTRTYSPCLFPCHVSPAAPGVRHQVVHRVPDPRHAQGPVRTHAAR